MIKYVATRPLTYATRRLLPGDEFEPKPAHGRLLVALKKAREKREPGKIAAPAKAVTEKVMPQAVEAQAVVEEIGTEQPLIETDEPAAVETAEHDDTAATRAEYQVKFGKRPYMGWDIEELRRRISEAE